MYGHSEAVVISQSMVPLENGNGWPGVVDVLLQNSTHCYIRGIEHKAVWYRWIRVSE